jgi:MFS family permease
MKDDQGLHDVLVPDTSSERIDCSWNRNATQMSVGVFLASAGAIVGFLVAPEPRILGGLIGFVGAGVVSVFVVGAVFAFIPPRPSQRSVGDIVARYRSCRRQFLICTLMIPLFLTLWPVLNVADSVAAWLVWGAAIAVLYVNSVLVHHRLTLWHCPRCTGGQERPIKRTYCASRSNRGAQPF